MNKLTAALLILSGLIHLLPLSGVLGAERLRALYDLPLTDPNLLILMQHRAVLFGLLGLFLILAAWRPALRSLALAGGLISVLSFILIAWLVGDYNAAIQRVVIADVVALIALLIASALHCKAPGRPC